MKHAAEHYNQLRARYMAGEIDAAAFHAAAGFPKRRRRKSTPTTPDERTAAGVTLCIFRRWRSGRKGVIALFPEEPDTRENWECSCYQHTGQHGGADYTRCIELTRPASLDEPDVAALRRELESEPFNYRLEIRQKAPSDAYQTRKAKLERQRGATYIVHIPDPGARGGNGTRTLYEGSDRAAAESVRASWQSTLSKTPVTLDTFPH